MGQVARRNFVEKECGSRDKEKMLITTYTNVQPLKKILREIQYLFSVQLQSAYMKIRQGDEIFQ